MRKSKSFKIEGHDKQFEIKELTAREIISIFQGDASSSEEASGKSIADSFKDDLLPKCSNIVHDDLLDLTPSEIEFVYDQFKEVNKSFFDVARKAGMGRVIEEMIKGIIDKYSVSLVNLLRPGIPEHSTTDGHISSQPLEPTD